jgi:hypothetical protein
LERAAAKLAPPAPPDRAKLTPEQRAHCAALLGRDDVPDTLDGFSVAELRQLRADALRREGIVRPPDMGRAWERSG